MAIRAVGQQDYDDAAAALRQAEANMETRKRVVEAARAAVESARINLSYTPIKSPISGRIGISNITVGALVTAYQPAALAVVQQLDPIYVDVTQASADLLSLRRRLESGQSEERRADSEQGASCSSRTGLPTRSKASCSSATSRWIRPRARSCCAWSSPTPITCFSPACSCGRSSRRA